MKEIERVAQLLADINFVLITGGANTRRVLRNVNRIAGALNYRCDIFYSFSAIILTLYNNTTGEKETVVKSIPHHGVNFNAISDISILSWRILEKKLPINVIEREVAYIKGKSHYNMYLMWFFVSLAGGSLAYIFGGDHHNSYLEFGMSFLATLLGLAGRRILQLRKFNIFICWAWAAFISVSVVNGFRLCVMADPWRASDQWLYRSTHRLCSGGYSQARLCDDAYLYDFYRVLSLFIYLWL